MKKLSDYKGTEAIELWGKLVNPISKIVGNAKIKKAISEGDKTVASIAGAILNECPKEVFEVLILIDGSELNGFNVLPRVMGILTEFSESEEFGSFFKFAEQQNTANGSTGSATENIKGGEN